MSSGATPGSEIASAQCIPDVVDSARSVRPYPGDLHVSYQNSRGKNRGPKEPLTFRSRHPYTHLNKDKYQGYIGSILIVMLQSCDLRIGELLEQRGYKGCVLAKETVPGEKDSRNPAYSFYLSGVHKIKGLNLFHDRTEKLDFSTTSRRGTSPFYL